MKATIIADMLVIRRSVLPSTIAYLVIALVIGIGMQSLYGMAACLAAMTPFLTVFTLMAYDNQNGWETFRAALPVRREDIAWGRYASVMLISILVSVLGTIFVYLIGQLALMVDIPYDFIEGFRAENDFLGICLASALGASIILLVSAVTFPFLLRFGLTKGTRILPILLVFLVPVSIGASKYLYIDQVAQVLNWISNHALESTLIMLVVVCALYALSALVASKLCAQREL